MALIPGRPTPEVLREQTIGLRDGRRVGFRGDGAPDGAPLLLFPGIPGSRLVPASFAAAARRHGIALIAVERPGIGLSDFQPGRALLDWPRDVAEVAQSLGLARFDVMGTSGGGAYALACAHELPGRVRRAVVVSGLTPRDRYGLVADVAADAGALATAALRVPGATRALFTILAAAMRHSPEHAAEKIAEALSAPDKRFLASEDGRQLLGNLVEAVRQGGRGWARDAAVTALPWGFAPASIQGEVQLWHGDEDDAVPLAHAQMLADELPRGELTIRHGYGHMGLTFEAADDILASLARAR